jgi:putative protease
LGKVTQYYSRLGVVVLKLQGPLGRGDRIHIAGRTTDLEELVESMEIDHRQVSSARPGDDVAVRVAKKVRQGDMVYLHTANGAAPSSPQGSSR